MERAKEVMPPADNLKYASDIYEAAKDADAVLILTDWKEFAAIDMARLNRAVRFPIVIDGRNLYKPQEMQMGLHVCERGQAGKLPGAGRQATKAEPVA